MDAQIAQDQLIAALEHPIRLPVFEGPLDLLLFLIRKNELDIYDIPIEAVTRQYLEVLRTYEKMNLELAGDFFVMAATLMYIKSRMLLPKNEQAPQAEEEQEDVDPRWELVQQLLQYKKIKEAAGRLGDLLAIQQAYIPREVVETAAADKDERPLKPTDKIEVWNTFNLVLRRLAEKMVHGEIRAEQVTVADRMEFVLKLMETTPTFVFTSLLPEKCSIAQLVATFLAVLELARLKKLFIRQDDAFEEIFCEALGPAPAENLVLEHPTT